jgi:hypothetical protein
MKLSVHIDHLILDSDRPLTREALVSAIRRELGDRMAIDGTSALPVSSSFRGKASVESPASATSGLGATIYRSIAP